MRTRGIAACTLWLAIGLSADAGAQRPAPGDGPGPAPRARMEQQLRQAMWRLARQRVPLTDDQMRKLESASGRFDARRRTLHVEERTERQALRTEIAAGDRANQERVGSALDRLLQIQRQRLDIAAEEQRELATFMTPVERARYGALHDQLRRRAQAMQRRRGGEGMRGPARPR